MSYPVATDVELEDALASGDAVQAEWGRGTTIDARCDVLRKIAELHRQQGERLARAISEETGKSAEDAVGEIEFAASIYDYYAEHAPAFLADEPVPVTSGEGTAVIRRTPVGQLLGIMPWNFPAYQVARFAAPNLVLGNTILLKHAPQCPASAEILEGIINDAGVRVGAYRNLRLTNEQVAAAIADPRVRGISLTGSERAGAAVAEMAGRHLKKVVLELGGSDPFIVLGTDDLDGVVEAAVAARMENTGQACNAGKRFIIIDEFYDDFVARFTRAMAERAADCPPLSSLRAAENLEVQVSRAVAAGAEFRADGTRDGAWFPPGVLVGVDPSNPVFREELFGPVAMVFRVQSEDEAVALANDTEFGLGSYVFSKDPEQAHRVADQIEAGMVFVNCVGAEGAELPFGGTKRSGFGRELGRVGIDEFANKKLIRSAK